MAKLEYKILVVRDNCNFPNYDDWFASNSPWNQANFKIQTISPLVFTPELFQPELWDCIVWDSKVEILSQLQIPSLPIVILVSQTEEILGLNYLLKPNLTKELLISVINHQIIQTQLRQKLNKAEKTLEEYDLLRHKLELEQSVNLLLQSIHSSFDLSSIFTAATTGIGKILKLDRVEITQYIPEQGTWQPVIEYRSHDQIPSTLGVIIPDQDNQISNKLKQGEIVSINSYAEINCSVNQILYAEYPGSWLMVPLVVGADVWGAISMDCHGRTRHWLSAEVDLAINISTQLAIAIQQCKFYQDLQAELKERKEGEAKRHQVEQDLLQSENRYRQVVETQSDFILRSHQDTTIAYVNESLCHALGVTSEQIIGQKWLNFLPKNEIPSILHQISILKPESPSFLMENHDYRANLTIGWTQWVNQGIFDKNGQLVEIQSVGRDITALKQAETELKQLNQDLEIRIEKRTSDLRRSKEILQISEQRFRSFFTLAPIGIAVADAQTFQLVAVNQAYCQFLGYTEDELLKIESVNSITEPTDWALEQPLTDSMIKGGINSYQLEQRFIKKSEQIVIGEVTATKISDLAGNVTHIIKMVQDVTDRKRDKEALKRSKELLRLTIENTPIGILTLDLSGKFLTVNQDACRIFGYSSEELLQITTNDITHPDSTEKTIKLLRQIVSGELVNAQIEKQYIHKSGKIIDAISRVGIVRDEDGNALHFVAGVEDITDRKRTEKALNQQFKRQNFITKITQQIRQSLDLEEVLTAAVNEVSTLLKCDRIIICQLHRSTESKVVKEIVKPEYPSMYRMNWSDEHLVGEGFEYYITSKSRIVNDVFQDRWSPNLNKIMRRARVKSKIVAPIIQNIQTSNLEKDQLWVSQNNQLWGFLIVHSCGDQRQWQPEEADLLQQVANQLAIAIQQAGLYAQIANELSTRKHLELELSRQAAADRLLSEITISINESFKLDQVLDLTLQKVQQLLESDRVLIFEIGADGNGKVVKESVSNPALSILNSEISDSCFATTDLVEQYLQGKVTIFEDIQTANITSCYADLMHKYCIKANLAAPIIHSNQLWGLLLVHQCYSPKVWLPSEINLIKQVATQIGISAHKEKLNLRLTSELNQKEILLREIHHRVKNNLQVMSSLLRLQFRKTTPEVKALCEEYQNRIQSMALIHDQLHRSNDLANIDFYRYITNLTTNLFQCYGANSDLVQLHIGVKDIYLPLDQSIPLGLIINELVSNALKYAFPEGYGKININLTQSGQLLHLTVADNGIGIPESFELETTDSLGMQLVYSLTDQLEGEVICDRTSGTKFGITFPIV